MIVLKELRWSNAFSYGQNNKINFLENPLVQLVGKNGHGKSSIALILEEVLFNKNSKNIKKADILNRYVKEKTYSIELDFAKDSSNYTIKSTRGSTQTVKLFRDDIDISAHTATATYKIIEELLGIDHKTFTQIVYQSSASSLEFLTATDTNRKKFLIELLNLTKYTVASEVFKTASNTLNKDIEVTQAKVNTVVAWLDKYKNIDLSVQSLVEVPEVDPKLQESLTSLQHELTNIDTINAKITKNNGYKEKQSQIKLTSIPNKPSESTDAYKTEVAKLQKAASDAHSFIKKMNSLHDTCPTCLSKIDEAKVRELVMEKTSELTKAQEAEAIAKQQIAELDKLYKQWEQATKAQQDWDYYNNLIDLTQPSELLDKTNLATQISALDKSIKQAKQAVATAEQANKAALAHNTKVETVAKQLLEFNQELEAYSAELHTLSERMGVLNILTKTFSTNGLVAYKIECLVKDLEELTNQYLVDLSDGRFQIGFQVSASDKLNVVITDNAKDIDIAALSGGERARVNVATLLAIRKLMQSLSSSRINLLILDETVEALDVEGKEKLIEVLLKEDSLNTLLVSHGYSHPLLEKIHIVKQHNISTIEG